MKALIAVQPNDLNKVWPDIREEVASIEAPDGFIPEDVYAMCRKGAATLFLLMVDDQRVGYLVVRQQGLDLHIWQLNAKVGYDVLTQFRDELMGLARGANCLQITYGSTRAAWHKVSTKHGFKVRMVVYECPVDPPKPPNDGGSDEDQHVTH